MKLNFRSLCLAACLSLAAATPALAQLDSDAAADLQYMRQEEKLAHDLYNHFHEKWGAALFYNIAQSEQRHMEAVLNLLTLYGLADSAAGLAPGVFANAELQALYDSLEARGDASELAAVEAAIDVEETDIADLTTAIAATDQLMIRRVYQNLLKGSQNHLAAFSTRLESLGGTPQANGLHPGVSIYEPVSQTLYVPAINVRDAQGNVRVYDAMLHMVETLPQALELVGANRSDRLPSDIHASFDVATGIVIIPQLQVGALAIGAIEDRVYRVELEYIAGSNSPQLFSVRSLTVVQ